MWANIFRIANANVSEPSVSMYLPDVGLSRPVRDTLVCTSEPADDDESIQRHSAIPHANDPGFLKTNLHDEIRSKQRHDLYCVPWTLIIFNRCTYFLIPSLDFGGVWSTGDPIRSLARDSFMRLPDMRGTSVSGESERDVDTAVIVEQKIHAGETAFRLSPFFYATL